MTASERLRALCQRLHPSEDVPDSGLDAIRAVTELVPALPEIIAVIEDAEAEHFVALVINGKLAQCNCGLWTDACPTLTALAALRSKLDTAT